MVLLSVSRIALQDFSDFGFLLIQALLKFADDVFIFLSVLTFPMFHDGRVHISPKSLIVLLQERVAALVYQVVLLWLQVTHQVVQMVELVHLDVALEVADCWLEVEILNLGFAAELRRCCELLGRTRIIRLPAI